jgi:hypothetical protein
MVTQDMQCCLQSHITITAAAAAAAAAVGGGGGQLLQAHAPVNS